MCMERGTLQTFYPLMVHDQVFRIIISPPPPNQDREDSLYSPPGDMLSCCSVCLNHGTLHQCLGVHCQ
jgi:hypothetical protein